MRVGNDENIWSNTACPLPVSTAQINQSLIITVACNLVGSYISVQTFNGPALTLCEVKAYSGTCWFSRKLRSQVLSDWCPGLMSCRCSKNHSPPIEPNSPSIDLTQSKPETSVLRVDTCRWLLILRYKLDYSSGGILFLSHRCSRVPWSHSEHSCIKVKYRQSTLHAGLSVTPVTHTLWTCPEARLWFQGGLWLLLHSPIAEYNM